MAQGIGKRFHKKLIWEHWEISMSLTCFKIYSFSTIRKCGAGLFFNVKTNCYIIFSFFSFFPADSSFWKGSSAQHQSWLLHPSVHSIRMKNERSEVWGATACSNQAPGPGHEMWNCQQVAKTQASTTMNHKKCSRTSKNSGYYLSANIISKDNLTPLDLYLWILISLNGMYMYMRT